MLRFGKFAPSAGCCESCKDNYHGAWATDGYGQWQCHTKAADLARLAKRRRAASQIFQCEDFGEVCFQAPGQAMPHASAAFKLDSSLYSLFRFLPGSRTGHAFQVQGPDPWMRASCNFEAQPGVVRSFASALYLPRVYTRKSTTFLMI